MTTLVASPADDVAVARVDFYVGSALVGSAVGAPWSAAWDTTRVPDGGDTIRARAFDLAGKGADTAAVAVTVANPEPETATWFAPLGVPACGAGGAGCTSGTLLDGRGTVGPEQGQPNTIRGTCADGASGSYHVDESLDALEVTALDGTKLAPGKQVRVTARAWVYSVSSDRVDLYYAASAFFPSWNHIETLTPSATGLQTLTAIYTLPAGAKLQAVRAVLRYGGAEAACATGAYNDHDDLVFAVAPDAVAPAVALTAPAVDSVLSGTVTLTATATDDVAVARVDFYEGDTLVGSDAVAPYSAAWSTASLPNGDYTLSARAIDLAGNATASTAVPVSVLNTVLPEVATAVYDPILKAPKCAANAVGCTTGTLVTGRGPVGPEPMHPNTLHGSCADGAAGAFHTDESIDELTIETVDGSGLAPGKEAEIAATVWLYSDSDRLDLYFAPSAANPVWTRIATLTPSGSGEQTLRATYTIPAGGTLQAIRAVLRYGGSAAPCAPRVLHGPRRPRLRDAPVAAPSHCRGPPDPGGPRVSRRALRVRAVSAGRSAASRSR